jgi:predicted RNase H-related nuclease YkuK (DUF458 family)
MDLGRVAREITDYVTSDPEATYRLVIGTDSQTGDETHFVTAIIIHRQGKGGRYFYRHIHHDRIANLQQRVYFETAFSLETVDLLRSAMAKEGWPEDIPVEIHVDIGNVGETRAMIRDIVGMVVASGYQVRVKPDSFGASKIADRYTK